ncbi:ATPase, T2SS/T4P/T4SS family [Providencia hangzhouensis]
MLFPSSLQDYLNQPQGLILVTGPTGSGKTVTLYSALEYLNKSSRNISTIEDPIEIPLQGVNQTQVNKNIILASLLF